MGLLALQGLTANSGCLLPTLWFYAAACRLLGLPYCLDHILKDILLYFDMAICRIASYYNQEEEEEEGEESVEASVFSANTQEWEHKNSKGKERNENARRINTTRSNGYTQECVHTVWSIIRCSGLSDRRIDKNQGIENTGTRNQYKKKEEANQKKRDESVGSTNGKNQRKWLQEGNND